MDSFPSLSTDQVAAFVELHRQGSLRAAAEKLLITEQGLRNRLLVLERRLGVQLYRKSRGVRRVTPLTPAGKQFLPRAVAFLERASELCDMFQPVASPTDIHVVGSQYLMLYLLIDAAQRFHKAHPGIRVQLSARSERDIETLLREQPDVAFGAAAPYESSPDFEYLHLFSMDWSVITPRRHPLARRRRVRLAEIVPYPLILFERGSTGRQHVVEAFQVAGLSPHVEMEATNTDLIVRMVESGLGVSVVPLLASGRVTAGHKVNVVRLREKVRPIHSGILLRKGERPTPASQAFIDFVRATTRRLSGRRNRSAPRSP